MVLGSGNSGHSLKGGYVDVTKFGDVNTVKQCRRYPLTVSLVKVTNLSPCLFCVDTRVRWIPGEKIRSDPSQFPFLIKDPRVVPRIVCRRETVSGVQLRSREWKWCTSILIGP